MKQIIKEMRDFPSVEEVLSEKKLEKTITLLPRPIAADVVRNVIADQKKVLKKDKSEIKLTALFDSIKKQILFLKRKEISRVINCTGIVVHTNLGRAPLSDSLFDAVKDSVTGYGNIEFDTSSGKRGKRGEMAERYLSSLSGAEKGTVVNNCAAALFVILNTLSNRKDVIISRSELVQIGGGFRIPDILKKSGAKLKEIGTTNITTLEDYENSIDEKTGLILKVHQSNFAQRGFVDQVSIKELSAVTKKHNIPLINDLGSGVFIPTGKLLGHPEQTVSQSVREGADLTCFSGDKMLGGTQAGLIVGKSEYIERIKKNPIFRVLRADKIIFSMLEKLLTFYLNDSHLENIKLWSLLTVAESELYKTGKKILKSLGNPEGLSIEATKAYVGGGALPDSPIPSVGLVFSGDFNANKLLKQFRELSLPVIGRIEDERFILDLKVVDQQDYTYLEKSIKEIIE